MNEDIELILDDVKLQMKKSLDHASAEFAKLRAGKASPSMLDGVEVEYYGSPTPLSQVSNVNTPDAKTIVVQPWEKSIIPDIEKAILIANLGLNPQNDGQVIIINVPPLTEERRMGLVKQLKAEAENAKVGIRSARKEGNENIKKLEKDGLSEDLARDTEGEVQTITNNYITKIDTLVAQKEKEIMTV